jgi:hypothetical protein
MKTYRESESLEFLVHIIRLQPQSRNRNPRKWIVTCQPKHGADFQNRIETRYTGTYNQCKAYYDLMKTNVNHRINVLEGKS